MPGGATRPRRPRRSTQPSICVVGLLDAGTSGEAVPARPQSPLEAAAAAISSGDHPTRQAHVEARPSRSASETGLFARSVTPQASAGGPPEAECGGHVSLLPARSPAVSSQPLCARPQHPLTAAAPHGVGCEVTRGDPGGGGGALFRRSSGRSFRYSLVLEVHPRPAHHLHGSPTAVGDTLSFSPLPHPPFRRGPDHKTRALRSGNGQQRDALRERAAAAAQHEPCQRLQGGAIAAWRAPTTGLRQGSRLPASAGAEGSAVSVSVSVSCVKKH